MLTLGHHPGVHCLPMRNAARSMRLSATIRISGPSALRISRSRLETSCVSSVSAVGDGWERG